MSSPTYFERSLDKKGIINSLRLFLQFADRLHVGRLHFGWDREMERHGGA